MNKLRKFSKKVIPIVAIILLLGLILSRVYQPDSTLRPEITISAEEANQYIGDLAEVCGTAVSADFAEHIGGEPTFINFEEPHPNQLFTVVIWGNDRPSWSHPPEELYANREVCVSGRVRMHDGTPQIVADSPDQFRFRD